jgi:hypothetical protein
MSVMANISVWRSAATFALAVLLAALGLPGGGGTAHAATGTAPTVAAGPDQTVTLADTAFLPGRVSDDGLPEASLLQNTWTKVSGPGEVRFGRSDEAHTSAEFSAAGTYVLRLTSADGGGSGSDDVTVTVRTGFSTTLRVPADYPTIQAALDAAPTRALVLVSPGTYRETLYVPRTLTLASTFYTTGDRSLIDRTVISGASADLETAVIGSSAGPDTRVTGFTVRDGKDGIKVRGAAVVEDNILTALGTDAVDFPRDTTGLVQNNVMFANGDDGVDVNESSPVIVDNVMRNNTGDGVETRVTNGTAPVDEVVIRGNRILNNHQDGLQIIDDDAITTNASGSATLFTIDRNVIAGNTQAGLGLMDGGTTSEDYRAASLMERITVTNNTFDGNNHGITGGNNLVAVNNIFMRHQNIALKNVDGASRVAYNHFYGNGTNSTGSNVDPGTTYVGDPKLDADHAPLPGSPVIDAGTATYLMPTGEEAVSVHGYAGAAPDLGAIESPDVGGNRPPVVDAGADQAITLPAAASLSGTVSDDGLPTGSTVTTTWDTVSGPGTVTFANPGSATTTAQFSTAGTYQLRLTAGDGQLTTSDTLTVTVNPADTGDPENTAPRVNAGADQAVTLPAAATLSGTVSDDGLPTGSTVTTTWDTVSGPGTATLANPGSATTTAQFSTAGTYQLRLTAGDGQLTASDTLTVTVNPADTGGTVKQVEARVTAGTDDAEERSSGAVDLASSDVELVTDGSAVQTVGLRFPGLEIPRGAEVTAATIQFQVDEVSTDSASLVLRAQAADNALTFAASTRNVSGRPPTAASVAWLPPAWPTIGAHAAEQRTPDLRSLVQEVVARPGWVPGNALAFMVTGTGRRTAEALEGGPAALLQVSYRTSGDPGPTNTAPVVNAGADQAVTLPAAATLSGTVSDDGLPTGSTVTTTWSTVSGPGTATFANPGSATTTAQFPSAGTYQLRLTAGDGQLTASDTLTVTVNPADTGGTVTQVEAPVLGGSDDAEERSSGAVSLTSTDLELVTDGTQVQTVGLRFGQLQVPAGATIVRSWIQFSVDEATTAATTLAVAAQDADDAAPFTTGTGDLSRRLKTPAVAWAPAAWSTKGERSAAQRTPDLSVPLQRVVSRPGWSAGNAVVFLVTGTGNRTAVAREKSAAAGPVLHLEYRSP